MSILFLTSVYCNKNYRKKKAEENVLLPPDYNSVFAEYPLNEVDCQQQIGVAIDTVTLSLWEHGKLTVKPNVPVSGWSGVEGLSSPNVVRTFYNYHHIKECKKENDKENCPKTIEIVQDEIPLKICRSKAEYPRNSIENVAISSLFHIENALAFLLKTAPSYTDWQKLTLFVLPKIEQKTLTVVGGKNQVASIFKVNNLIYAPLFRKYPSVLIYPSDKGATINYWELPWAISHEIGHHVFNNVTRTVITDSSEMIETWREEIPSPSGLNLTEERVITYKTHWNAVSEGYADLFAHYVTGEEVDALAGVFCLDHNRNVISPNYGNNVEKILTANVLTAFHSRVKVARTSCNIPTFQDSHDIGALVAFSAHQIFTLSAQTPAQKLHLLIKWGETIAQSLTKIDVKSVTLSLLLNMLAQSLAVNNKLSSSQCEQFNKLYPALSKQWSTYSCKA